MKINTALPGVSKPLSVEVTLIIVGAQFGCGMMRGEEGLRHRPNRRIWRATSERPAPPPLEGDAAVECDQPQGGASAERGRAGSPPRWLRYGSRRSVSQRRCAGASSPWFR